MTWIARGRVPSSVSSPITLTENLTARKALAEFLLHEPQVEKFGAGVELEAPARGSVRIGDGVGTRDGEILP